MSNTFIAEDTAKIQYRNLVKDGLEDIRARLNSALGGGDPGDLQQILERIGRGGKIPHWFAQLKDDKSLPNADGKTIGSILEMLFVAIVEKQTLKEYDLKLKINPARGVDIPDLDLGVKSPSKNYCTSEPFYSAYERLYGNENDCIVLLTNYQESKGKNKLSLQVASALYMSASEIADKELCRIALKSRSFLAGESEARLQRVFKFLAYANQSDWRCRRLLRLTDILHAPGAKFVDEKKAIEKDFARINKDRDAKGSLLIAEEELAALNEVFSKPGAEHLALVDALENWVTEYLKDASRNPNENEWNRLRKSPLNGRIGMSFALQWRYNFGAVFSAPLGTSPSESAPIDLCADPGEDEAVAS